MAWTEWHLLAASYRWCPLWDSKQVCYHSRVFEAQCRQDGSSDNRRLTQSWDLRSVLHANDLQTSRTDAEVLAIIRPSLCGLWALFLPAGTCEDTRAFSGCSIWWDGTVSPVLSRPPLGRMPYHLCIQLPWSSRGAHSWNVPCVSGQSETFLLAAGALHANDQQCLYWAWCPFCQNCTVESHRNCGQYKVSQMHSGE